MAERHGPGRPRDQHIDQLLHEAVLQALHQSSYADLAIDTLASAAGVNRRSFYRRYPNVDYLVLDAFTQTFGSNIQPTTGSLRDDLLAMQQREVEMFNDPVFAHALPGLFIAVQHDQVLADRWDEEFIQPRRQSVATVLEAAIARDEIPPATVDFGFICDLLLGPLLARSMLPNTDPLTQADAAQSAHAAILLITQQAVQPT